jgi:PAS domain S-box-containing protein
MKNKKWLNDLMAIQGSAVSSGRLITSSRTWLEVADVMSRNVATASPDALVVSAAKVMAEKKISCLVVMDRQDVAGILTETDVLRRVVRNGKNFYRTKLAQIMSSPVETVSSDLSVLDASEIMGEKHIKRLPVLEGSKLVGIVTQTDLVQALTSYGLWKDISEVMSLNVAGIQSTASVAEAAEVTTSQEISCIVALDGEEVAGILTEKDLLGRVVALHKDPADVKIEHVMSSPVASIPFTCSIFCANKIMEEMNVRRLVVMKDKRLCGIVTQTDIFMAVRGRLQAEEERHFRSLEQSKDNIYTADLEGQITYVNPAFMELLEVSDPAELIGLPFLPDKFWLNPQEGKQFLDDLRKRNIESKELALRTLRGKKIYVTVFCSLTKNIHGETNGSQGIVYDVTPNKELVALREAEEELEKLNEHLKSAVWDLKRANRELQEFAYVAAHDLKTPLRAIGTLADWISRDYADKFDDQGKEQVRLLVTKAKQMTALIGDVLQYSSVGQSVQNDQKVDLNKVVADVITEVAPPDNIEVAIENELPAIMCKRTHVIQVFQNLVGNAVKYMDKPRGYVKIGYVEQDDSWKFSVADNGPGIDAKYFDKIFKIFQTLGPRKGVESTGIGLSIVKKLVELNKGRVWVESQVGKGSTFFFTLPK